MVFTEQATENLPVLDSGSDIENAAGLAKGEVFASGPRRRSAGGGDGPVVSSSY
jgi:hypothetical protein